MTMSPRFGGVDNGNGRRADLGRQRGQALRSSRVGNRDLMAELGEVARKCPSHASSTDDSDSHRALYHGQMATHGTTRRDFRELSAAQARLFAGGQKTQGAAARRQSPEAGRARAGRKPLGWRRASWPPSRAALGRPGPGAAASRPTSSWTLPRVAVVIERLTGIRLSPRPRVANPRAGWNGHSSARPSGAKERKSVYAACYAALGRRPLARGKKNAAAGAPGSSSRTRAAFPSSSSSAARGAPRGDTLVLTHAAFNWQRLSVAVALAFRWDRRRRRLFFQTRPGDPTNPEPR